MSLISRHIICISPAWKPRTPVLVHPVYQLTRTISCPCLGILPRYLIDWWAPQVSFTPGPWPSYIRACIYTPAFHMPWTLGLLLLLPGLISKSILIILKSWHLVHIFQHTPASFSVIIWEQSGTVLDLKLWSFLALDPCITWFGSCGQ